MITVTDSAAAKVKELLEQEDEADLALRVAVRPGGCSGFSYEMFFDSDVAEDDNKARSARWRSSSTPPAPCSSRAPPGLQGRLEPGRVRHRQPQRPAHLRLRPILQLIPAGQRPAAQAIWSSASRSSTRS